MVANYSLDETEDLNDEEYDDVIKPSGSVEDKNWFVCMNIGGYIRAQSPGGTRRLDRPNAQRIPVRLGGLCRDDLD